MVQLLDDSKCIWALALTISPPERVNRWNALKTIYRDDSIFINNQLRKCSKKYSIYAELDANGRLHYHGTVYVHDMVKWKKSVLPSFKRVIGFTKVKVIADEENSDRWQGYCLKEWDITKEVLDISECITYKLVKHKEAKIVDVNNKLLGYGFLECEPCDDDDEVIELIVDLPMPKHEESCDEETSLSQGSRAANHAKTPPACR